SSTPSGRGDGRRAPRTPEGHRTTDVGAHLGLPRPRLRAVCGPVYSASGASLPTAVSSTTSISSSSPPPRFFTFQKATAPPAATTTATTFAVFFLPWFDPPPFGDGTARFAFIAATRLTVAQVAHPMTAFLLLTMLMRAPIPRRSPGPAASAAGGSAAPARPARPP